jgi:hypothetical protein
VIAATLTSMVKPDNISITSFQWGRIVDSNGCMFKDARIFPGGVEEWDWRKTGTRHDPGIQAMDLADLVEMKPDVVILSRDVDLVLQVPQATIDFARSYAATVLVLQSEQAVAEYGTARLRSARAHTTGRAPSTRPRTCSSSGSPQRRTRTGRHGTAAPVHARRRRAPLRGPGDCGEHRQHADLRVAPRAARIALTGKPSAHSLGDRPHPRWPASRGPDSR